MLDHKWREHLYEMDYLREGIGLRAMAQRDPLIEYQREGYDMFSAMMEGIKEESVQPVQPRQFMRTRRLRGRAADGGAAQRPPTRHPAAAAPAAAPPPRGPAGRDPARHRPAVRRPRRGRSLGRQASGPARIR